MNAATIFGDPDPVGKLIKRLLKSAEIAEAAYSPAKGAPLHIQRAIFTAQLLSVFDKYAPVKATSTPKAAFDTFLGYVLEEAAGEKGERSRRTLIETAMALRDHRGRLWRQCFALDTFLTILMGRVARR